jgi:hypothetical protein
LATKKIEPIETRMKKACADLYKVISSFPEPPERITVEGKTLQLLYSQTRGVVTMYVQQQSENDWFADIPNFNIDLQDLKALKEPKNIGAITPCEEGFHVKLLKSEDSVTIRTFKVTKEYNPVKEIVDSLGWLDFTLPANPEQLQLNLKDGSIGVPGTQALSKEPSSVLYLNKRNIPKPFLIGETLFAVQPKDDNFGTPFGLFITEKFVTLVEFKNILIDI